jgi:hypothetical protein
MVEIVYSMCIFQTLDNHEPFIVNRKGLFNKLIENTSENACEIIRMTLECLNDDALKREWDQKSELVSLLY